MADEIITTPIAARPRRRNTKQRIIDEAEALASIHGIEHLKLQDVADKIGIKLPSVYAHFSGREDILAAMSNRIATAFNDLYVPNAGERAVDTLSRGVRELTEFLANNPAYYRLMCRNLSVPMGYTLEENTQFARVESPKSPPEFHKLLERVDRLIQSAAGEGDIKALDALDFISCIQGTLITKLSLTESLGSVSPGGETGHNLPDTTELAQSMNEIFNRITGRS
jgi:AcrR family transcriptional regulator